LFSKEEKENQNQTSEINKLYIKMGKIFCKNCNKELSEEEKPCSNCCCLYRIYKEEPIVYLKMRIGSKWKHERPGYKRPIAEGKSRYKISRDPKLADQEVYEEYVIDRIKKGWYQIVKDVKTGKIIHKENKPLDQK
jgi:hypothetical protein